MCDFQPTPLLYFISLPPATNKNWQIIKKNLAHIHLNTEDNVSFMKGQIRFVSGFILSELYLNLEENGGNVTTYLKEI